MRPIRAAGCKSRSETTVVLECTNSVVVLGLVQLILVILLLFSHHLTANTSAHFFCHIMATAATAAASAA